MMRALIVLSLAGATAYMLIPAGEREWNAGESVSTARVDPPPQPRLPEGDRKRLIDELYDTISDDDWKSFDNELDCDIAEVEAGDTKGTPWLQVRDEALDSLKNEQAR